MVASLGWVSLGLKGLDSGFREVAGSRIRVPEQASRTSRRSQNDSQPNQQEKPERQPAEPAEEARRNAYARNPCHSWWAGQEKALQTQTQKCLESPSKSLTVPHRIKLAPLLQKASRGKLKLGARNIDPRIVGFPGPLVTPYPCHRGIRKYVPSLSCMRGFDKKATHGSPNT